MTIKELKAILNEYTDDMETNIESVQYEFSTVATHTYQFGRPVVTTHTGTRRLSIKVK